MKLTNEQLHQKLIVLTTQERSLLSNIIEHLQEVYNRKLYVEKGYGTMVRYLIKEFKYSQSAATRRYQALRLVKEVPEAKGLIEAGELNLGQAGFLDSALKGVDDEKKKELINEVKGKTQDETKDIIFDEVPEAEIKYKKREKRTKCSSTETRLEITLGNDILATLDELREFTRKRDSQDCLRYALELAKKHTILKKGRPAKPSKYQRAVSKQMQRDTWIRDGGVCQHPGCEERKFLEYDHIRPIAQGGQSTFDNIQLLCRAHNQYKS